MGFRLISLAIRHKSRALILEALGLEATGTTIGHLDAKLVGTQLGKWYVVTVMNSDPYRCHVDDLLLSKLAEVAEIVVCGVNEGTNVAFATCWSAGRQAWAVLHEPNLFPDELLSEGDVPPELAAIKERAQAEQARNPIAEVDVIFDVPVDLCERLTGFRHDSRSADVLRYDVLREIVPTSARDEADRYMDVEGRPAVPWPLALQARAAIDAMTPNGGPGFVILQAANGDYMQTAGGDGAYLAEWREHAGGGFKHYVAGRKGVTWPGTIRIETNGAHVTCRRNERLTALDVKALATAFLRRETRPSTYAWRDISDEFA